MTLTSTLDGRQTACPGEVVTYACTVLHTTVVSWFALPDIDGVGYLPRSPVGQQVIGGFVLALTNKVPDPNNAALADLTITLTVTATLAHNGTEVQCRGDERSERMSLVLNIAGEQSVQLMVTMFLKIRAKKKTTFYVIITLLLLLFVPSVSKPAADHQGHCFL